MKIPTQNSKLKIQNWFSVLWLLALMVYVLAGTAIVPFHGDESTIIMMSRDYHYQFIARDLDLVAYHDPPLNGSEQALRLINGTTSKTLIGLSWHLAGFTVDDLNGEWNWGEDYDWNVASRNRPTDDLLLASRWHAALLTALSIPLIFVLALMWKGRGAAYAASFFLAVHPVILLNGRRAMFEAELLFFGLLTVTLAAWWIRLLSNTKEVGAHRDTPLRWVIPLMLGIAAGLTVASKHSGAVLVAACYVALLFGLLWRVKSGRQSRRLQQLITLILSGVVALGVFLLLNPAWWSDPLARVGQVLDMREGLVGIQVEFYPETVYADFPARVGGLFYQLSTAPPAYYEVDVWADWIADETQAYETTPWTGIFYGANSLTTLLGLAFLGLALVGTGRLIGRLRAGDTTALLVGLWGGLTALMILVANPLAWQRYYLPLYPVEALLAGVGLMWLVGRVGAWR